jgi:hypothetical protein
MHQGPARAHVETLINQSLHHLATCLPSQARESSGTDAGRRVEELG